MFQGQHDFISVTSRDRFLDIRGSLAVHDPRSYDHSIAVQDPLWHSRTLLSHIQANFTKYAVPGAVSSLDENSIRSKARSKAISYMTSKPDKFVVRFYAVVDWRSTYLFSVVDNGRGCELPSSPGLKYVSLHRATRTPFQKWFPQRKTNLPTEIESDTPTALWVSMLAHMEQLHTSGREKRLVYMDNFYTQATLADALLKMSDEKVRIPGTVRLNFVKATDLVHLSEAHNRLKELQRGSWFLVASFLCSKDLDKQRAVHNKKYSKTPKPQVPKFVPKMGTQRPHAGYIDVKDKGIVTMFSNNLAGTPSKAMLMGTDAESNTFMD